MPPAERGVEPVNQWLIFATYLPLDVPAVRYSAILYCGMPASGDQRKIDG
jgi:hypothetical protein